MYILSLQTLNIIQIREAFPYEDFFGEELERKHRDKSYRYFNQINRLARHFPRASTPQLARDLNGSGEMVTVWCSNDYLGMGSHPCVLQAMHQTLDAYGAGAGGMRKMSIFTTVIHYIIILIKVLEISLATESCICVWNNLWPICIVNQRHWYSRLVL